MSQENTPHQQTEPQLYLPRSVAAHRGVEWLADGVRLFLAQPSSWLLICVMGLAVLIGSSMLSSVPVLGYMVPLFNYVWIAGLVVGCKALDRGENFNADALFLGFKHNLPRLLLLGGIMFLASTVVTLLAFYGMYDELRKVTAVPPGSLPDLSNVDVHGLLLRSLISLALLVPLSMLVWFAPVLIAIHDAPIKSAMRLSFLACLRNVVPFLLYGLVLLVALVIGSIPFMLGLLVVMPMFFASVYASYKDIFLHQTGVLNDKASQV